VQQLTFVGPHRLEWEDVPAPELSSGDDAPAALARLDAKTVVIR
jgi:hypothetical protein